MRTIEMRDLAVSARGVRQSDGTPPPHIMGMVSSVRSAMRMVHADSPEAGVLQIQERLGHWSEYDGDPNPGKRATATAARNYIAVVERCAEWHGRSPLMFRVWEEKGLVRYNEDDVLEVLVRVVLEDEHGHLWGRVILWDGPKLDLQAASILASPVAEVLTDHYESTEVEAVEAWQCRTGESHVVSAADARRMRATVAAHVARM